MWATAVVVVLAALGLTAFLMPASVDRRMMRNLEQHRAQFERLVEMFAADQGVNRVSADAGDSDPVTLSAAGVDARRAAEYDALLRDLSLTAIERDAGRLYLYAVRDSSEADLPVRGYIYSAEALATYDPEFESLGEHDARSDALVSVDRNWYIFYTVQP